MDYTLLVMERLYTVWMPFVERFIVAALILLPILWLVETYKRHEL